MYLSKTKTAKRYPIYSQVHVYRSKSFLLFYGEFSQYLSLYITVNADPRKFLLLLIHSKIYFAPKSSLQVFTFLEMHCPFGAYLWLTWFHDAFPLLPLWFYSASVLFLLLDQGEYFTILHVVIYKLFCWPVFLKITYWSGENLHLSNIRKLQMMWSIEWCKYHTCTVVSCCNVNYFLKQLCLIFSNHINQKSCNSQMRVNLNVTLT